MIVVDSHCHASPVWYEPIESLLFQMDRNGVAHAVLVQMSGQYDNSYQEECVRRYPGRFASVVIVDTAQPDAVQMLERLAATASGVRLRPDTRSPGDDPLAIWRAAGRLKLAVSCIGSAAAFAADAFGALVQAVPETQIVIEHLGGLKGSGEGSADELRRAVFGLARFPNTAMKLPGLGEFCRRQLPVPPGPFPFERPIAPLLEMAYDAFGPQRLMWGSDFPPVSQREGYALALRLPMEQLAARSEADRAAIFGGTALRLFPVR